MNPSVLVSAAIAAVSTAAHAQLLTQWVGPDGFWADPTNWDGGLVPEDLGAVGIQNGATVTADNLDIRLRTGIVGGTFDGITGDGFLHQIGGTIRFENTTNGVFAGFGQGTAGRIDLSGGATMESVIFAIGADGSGHSTITGGSSLTATAVQIAGRFRGTSFQRYTSVGSLTVDGPGTRVRATLPSLSGALSVGTDGEGHLTISNGAVVETHSGLVVSTVEAGSSLSIEGAGSVLRFGLGDSSNFLGFGRDVTLFDDPRTVGDTIVTLRDGGRIENAAGFGSNNGVQLATQTVLRGSGQIISDVQHAGDAIIDPGENGSFGHFEIAGLLNNRLEDFGDPTVIGGILNFDLGGTGDGEFDRLTVGGLRAGGTLSVSLADGFDAAFGDTFEIISILDQGSFVHDGEMGTFGIVDLPTLGDGLFFETLYSNTSVTLRVVPTPGTLGLASAVMLIAGRRRR